MLRGYIFDTNFVYRMFVALLISKPSKNSVSVTILLSCNSKGLIFDFHLNRKRNVLVGVQLRPIYMSVYLVVLNAS